MAGGGQLGAQSASPTTQGPGLSNGNGLGLGAGAMGFGGSPVNTYPGSQPSATPIPFMNRVNQMGMGQPAPYNPAQPQNMQRGFSPEAHAAMMRHRELIQQARTPAPVPQAAPIQQAPRQPYQPTADDRAYWAGQRQERAAREEAARQAGLRSIEGLGLNMNENLAARSNVAASVPMNQQNLSLAQRRAFENEARRLR